MGKPQDRSQLITEFDKLRSDVLTVVKVKAEERRQREEDLDRARQQFSEAINTAHRLGLSWKTIGEAAQISKAGAFKYKRKVEGS